MYYPQLTGIRAVAAYLVFLHHFHPFRGVVGRFLDECHIGVTLFFVLSGFLIAHRYQMKDGWDARVLFSYFVNRWARIYPMFLVVTLVALVFHYGKGDFSGRQLAKVTLLNLTLTRGFFDELKFSGVPQGWSITVEECFYVVAPFVFLVYRRTGRLWPQFLLTLGFGIALTGTIVATKFWVNGFFGTFRFFFLYTYFGRSFEFFVGIFLSTLLRKGDWEANTVRRTYLGGFGIVVCIAALSILPRGKGIVFGVQRPEGIVINNFVLPCFVALLYCGLLTEKSRLRSLLSHPLALLLGGSSYVFYLIHLGPLQEGIDFILKPIFGDGPRVLVIFVAMVLISIVLFRYIEEPLNRFFRRWATRMISQRQGAERETSLSISS